MGVFVISVAGFVVAIAACSGPADAIVRLAGSIWWY